MNSLMKPSYWKNWKQEQVPNCILPKNFNILLERGHIYGKFSYETSLFLDFEKATVTV